MGCQAVVPAGTGQYRVQDSRTKGQQYISAAVHQCRMQALAQQAGHGTSRGMLGPSSRSGPDDFAWCCMQSAAVDTTADPKGMPSSVHHWGCECWWAFMHHFPGQFVISTRQLNWHAHCMLCAHGMSSQAYLLAALLPSMCWAAAWCVLLAAAAQWLPAPHQPYVLGAHTLDSGVNKAWSCAYTLRLYPGRSGTTVT